MPALETNSSIPAAEPSGAGADRAHFAPQPPYLAASVDALQPQAYLDADARAGASPNGKPSYTIDQAANQLIRGEPGWSGALGHAAVVTYAYRASAPAAMPADSSGFQRFGQAQIDQAELALRAWSDVANITFVRVGAGDAGEGAYSDSAAILLGDYTTGESGVAAFSYFPGSAAAGSSDGDVWINGGLFYNRTPVIGGYGAEVLTHELGHAIGLAHPSEYDAAAGQTLTYSADASYYEDSRQYTLMSYFGEGNTGGNFAGFYPAAPMLDDIAAAQREYGANMATRTGDTVYGFNSNADRPWFGTTSAGAKLVFAVWDAGGVNTFDFSGYSQNQLIDLRAGNFSNVGGLVGNVAIAQGTTIQDAIGGSGDDVIWGNGANDVLSGGAGADRITSGAGFNNVNGNKGDDTLVGASSVGDWLSGGQGNDSIVEHSGAHNLIFGNLGGDTLQAGTGGDTVRGGQADDVVMGGPGADWLSGDMGHNTLIGGGGADLFHASPTGIDVVSDFSQGQGDRALIDAGVTYSVQQQGADTVIALSTGGQMTLSGVTSAALGAGWILQG